MCFSSIFVVVFPEFSYHSFPVVKVFAIFPTIFCQLLLYFLSFPVVFLLLLHYKKKNDLENLPPWVDCLISPPVNPPLLAIRNTPTYILRKQNFVKVLSANLLLVPDRFPEHFFEPFEALLIQSSSRPEI